MKKLSFFEKIRLSLSTKLEMILLFLVESLGWTRQEFSKNGSSEGHWRGQKLKNIRGDSQCHLFEKKLLLYFLAGMKNKEILSPRLPEHSCEIFQGARDLFVF